ncbi:M56 family metallopeptidase [Alterisphingorhabdus coralli]|uniref:M56 family metallopeptidase n=1 Tax=Alterisphingorhabdus coralli TaxID=3071408 RepID=A0AA97F685_9SPHN|nr:M56 family metallopeptidase [Parasphingorhabdus sp. SCSIO 66989]WOE75114.1 M56 family metallopeptidase [Parasphingorhabdus sp. SCSIO 66989]
MSNLSLAQIFSTETWLLWSGDTMIATALLIAVVLLIRRPVAHFFGAQLSYLLWLLPLARLFLPAFSQTIEVDAPLANVKESIAAKVAEGAGAPAAVVADAPPAHDAMAPWLSDFGIWPLLITVWLGGAALFLIVQLAIYLQHRREILADARELNRIDDIRIVEVADIEGPFAFGVLRRFIAVPLDFATRYTDAEQRLALRHELSHHKARDLWANFAALLLLALHWFNPLAWLAYRYFRFDQEAACDARVLARADDQERAQYSRLIAKAATGRTLALGSPLTPRGKLKERLILMNQQPKSRARRALGSAAMIGGTATALALTATVSYAYVVKPVEKVDLEPSEVTEIADVRSVEVTPEPPEAPTVEVSDEDVVIDSDGTRVIVIETLDQDDDVEVDLDQEVSREVRVFHSDAGETERVIRVRTDPKTRIAISEAKAEALRARAEAHARAEEARVLALESIEGMNVELMIPQLSFRKDCSRGADTEKVVTDTSNGRTMLMVRMCDREHLAEARSSALEGLREARDDIASETDIPEKLRKKLMRTFDEQIARLEAERS